MDAQSCHVAPAGLREAEREEEGEEEERTQSLSPTSLHQPPVGGGAADEQEDAEENQGQADAHDGACRRAGGMRLRVLAWGEDGSHRPSPGYPRRRPTPGARAPTAVPGGLQGAPAKLSPPPCPPARTLCPFPRRSTRGKPSSRHQAGVPGTRQRCPRSHGNRARRGGLHTTLVREQVRVVPRVAGQRCRMGTLQLTPAEGESRTSALEERFPHRSSWHSCLPHLARCSWLSHSACHRPSWKTSMSPSQGVGPAASLRRAWGWEPGGERGRGGGQTHGETSRLAVGAGHPAGVRPLFPRDQLLAQGCSRHLRVPLSHEDWGMRGSRAGAAH